MISAFPVELSAARNSVGSTPLVPASPMLEHTIMPGEMATDQIESTPREPVQYYRRWIVFRDSNGVDWCRDLRDGRLLKRSSMRARFRFRRGLWRWSFGRGRSDYRRWIASPRVEFY